MRACKSILFISDSVSYAMNTALVAARFPCRSVVAIMDRLQSIIALPDEIIILQNTPGEKMYFLAQGQVKVTVKTADGPMKFIKYMGRGEGEAPASRILPSSS